MRSMPPPSAICTNARRLERACDQPVANWLLTPTNPASGRNGLITRSVRDQTFRATAISSLLVSRSSVGPNAVNSPRSRHRIRGEPQRNGQLPNDDTPDGHAPTPNTSDASTPPRRASRSDPDPPGASFRDDRTQNVWVSRSFVLRTGIRCRADPGPSLRQAPGSAHPPRRSNSLPIH